MFKAFISKGHPEFSSNRQQDAREFFLHLINLVEVRKSELLLLFPGCVRQCCYEWLIFCYTLFSLGYMENGTNLN